MTTQNDPLDLEPIKARAAAATKAPWRFKPDTNRDGRILAMIHTPLGWLFNDWTGINDAADGVFVAAARTDIDALVAEVEYLRSVIAIRSGAES